MQTWMKIEEYFLQRTLCFISVCKELSVFLQTLNMLTKMLNAKLQSINKCLMQ